MAHRHVDTRLEEALEAVLVRYGIPAYGLRVRAAVADRGDLASDLADAARSTQVLPPEVAATVGAAKERLAAITQGHWVSSIDIEPEDGAFWPFEDIIAVDELPVPDYSRGLPDDEGEEAGQRVSDWADAHCRGTIASTHNYLSIPDAEHDANQRLMAHAPADLAMLVGFIEGLNANGR